VDAIAIADPENQFSRGVHRILGDHTQILEFAQGAQALFVELGWISHRQGFLELRDALRGKTFPRQQPLEQKRVGAALQRCFC